MPAVWTMWSKEIIGYVAEQTEINEEYVAVGKIQQWLDKGMNVKDIALKWNAGGAKVCSKGVNKKGVRYDSCKYVAVVTSHYNNN